MLWSYYRTNVTENVFDSTKGQTHTHTQKNTLSFAGRRGVSGSLMMNYLILLYH